jgi:hypothetical protein
MTATWKRWQDWATVVVGVLLFIAPFAFGAAGSAAAWTAYIGGILLAVAGLWSVSSPTIRYTDWAEVVLGVLLILAPFVVGFAAMTAIAWSVWIAGILAVVLGGWVLLSDRGRQLAVQH